MSSYKKLNALLASAPRIPINNRSRIVLFSDCHRGDGGPSDNFMKNQNLYYYALSHYYEEGFTYIELGDGDELWENKRLSDIIEAHGHVYWLLSRFCSRRRLYMLYGNHDREKCRYQTGTYPACLSTYFDARAHCRKPLCPDLPFYEALVLHHEETGREMLLAHGHQGDWFNDSLWPLARFLVRYVWRPLETFLVSDPTSAAKNYKKRDSVERRLSDWAQEQHQMLVAGHTHRPVFPAPDEAPYWNTGSCIHPRCITGIEIDQGWIRLVKWTYFTKEDGTVYVGRELLEGPRGLNTVLLNG